MKKVLSLLLAMPIITAFCTALRLIPGRPDAES